MLSQERAGKSGIEQAVQLPAAAPSQPLQCATASSEIPVGVSDPDRGTRGDRPKLNGVACLVRPILAQVRLDWIIYPQRRR